MLKKIHFFDSFLFQKRHKHEKLITFPSLDNQKKPKAPKQGMYVKTETTTPD